MSTSREEMRAYQKRWYQENKPRILANRRVYYAENRDNIVTRVRTYYVDNKDAILPKRKQYRDRTKEKTRARDAAYRLANRETLLARARNYYYAHRDAALERSRNSDWKKRNPDKANHITRRRRARKSGNGGSFTLEQWRELKRQYAQTCLACGLTEPEIIALGRTLVPDHVVPVSKGGTSDISNIQPLCHGKGGCNLKKAARHIDYRKVVA